MPVSLVTQPSLDNHIRPMWQIERAPASDGSRVVRLGEARFALSQVAHVSAGVDVTRHRHGRVVAMLLFGLLAAVLLIGVFDFGLARRFLIAVFICASIALMSLEDIVFARPQRLATFDVRLADGRHVRWSTADEAEAAALNAVLMHRS